MSSYITFYVKREDNDNIITLKSFCGSSIMYQVMSHYVPYSKAKIIDTELNSGRAQLISRKDTVNENIEFMERMIETLKSIEGCSLDEKMDRICEYYEAIGEQKEEIKEIDAAINFIDFMKDLKEAYYAVPEAESRFNEIVLGYEEEVDSNGNPIIS